MPAHNEPITLARRRVDTPLRAEAALAKRGYTHAVGNSPRSSGMSPGEGAAIGRCPIATTPIQRMVEGHDVVTIGAGSTDPSTRTKTAGNSRRQRDPRSVREAFSWRGRRLAQRPIQRWRSTGSRTYPVGATADLTVRNRDQFAEPATRGVGGTSANDSPGIYERPRYDETVSQTVRSTTAMPCCSRDHAERRGSRDRWIRVKTVSRREQSPEGKSADAQSRAEEWPEPQNQHWPRRSRPTVRTRCAVGSVALKRLADGASCVGHSLSTRNRGLAVSMRAS